MKHKCLADSWSYLKIWQCILFIIIRPEYIVSMWVCWSVRRLLATTKKDNDLKICRKNAVSRGFSAFLLDCLVENYIYIAGRDFISR